MTMPRGIYDRKKFQSTHLREVRLLLGVEVVAISMFQSTHLREVRLNEASVLSPFMTFQSTHLREVRHDETSDDSLDV